MLRPTTPVEAHLCARPGVIKAPTSEVFLLQRFGHTRVVYHQHQRAIDAECIHQMWGRFGEKRKP